jgi:hypothetical protein
VAALSEHLDHQSTRPPNAPVPDGRGAIRPFALAASVALVPAHPGHPGGEPINFVPWGIVLLAAIVVGLAIWRLARLGGAVSSAERELEPAIDEPLVRPAGGTSELVSAKGKARR